MDYTRAKPLFIALFLCSGYVILQAKYPFLGYLSYAQCCVYTLVHCVHTCTLCTQGVQYIQVRITNLTYMHKHCILVHMDYNKYTNVHMWLKYNFKKPTKCSNPECLGLSKRIEWANISGTYKKDISDYEALCVSCHRKKDYQTRFGNKCKKGHEYTPENTYYRNKAKGWRVCKKCNDSRVNKYICNTKTLKSHGDINHL